MNYSGELLKRDAQIKLDHIPFKGAAPLVHGTSCPAASSSAAISSRLRCSMPSPARCARWRCKVATRSPALPDVPTVREQGFAFLELQGWNGFFAPAGTPDAIVQRLHKEIVAAVEESGRARQDGDGRRRARRLDRRRRCATCCVSKSRKVKPVIEDLKLDRAIDADRRAPGRSPRRQPLGLDHGSAPPASADNRAWRARALADLPSDSTPIENCVT